MNETKKIITIFVAIVLLIIAVIGINSVTQKENQKVIDKYEKLLNSKEKELIFIGRPTCTYCQQLMPHLEEITDTYKIKYTYLNTDEYDESTLNKLLKLFNTDSSTPQLLIVKEGKIQKTQEGYTDREGLFKFFQDGGLISKDEKLIAADANLNKISYDDYNELISEKEDNVIVIAQTGCSHCENAKPALNSLAKEYDIEINWFNISDLSEDERNEFRKSLDILNSDFGTPLIMVVNDKKVVSSTQGFEDKEQMVTFLKNNKIIK